MIVDLDKLVLYRANLNDGIRNAADTALHWRERAMKAEEGLYEVHAAAGAAQLGLAEGERLIDAARRVVAERDQARASLEAAEARATEAERWRDLYRDQVWRCRTMLRSDADLPDTLRRVLNSKQETLQDLRAARESMARITGAVLGEARGRFTGPAADAVIARVAEVTAERDEARAALDTFRAGRTESESDLIARVRVDLRGRDERIDRVRQTLGAAPGETVEAAAERAHSAVEIANRVSRSLAHQVDNARDALGAAAGETVAVAARRVAAERDEARQRSSAFTADGTAMVATGDGKVERLSEVIRERDRLADLSKAARGILLSHTGQDLDEAMDVEDVAVAVAAEIMRARRILGALECEALSEGARRPVRERDEAHADINAARDILGTPPGETLRAAVTRLRDQSDMAVRSGHSLADQLDAVRDALGVVAGDVVDAAQRVAADRGAARAELVEIRAILGAGDGQPLAVRARDLMAQLELMSEAAEGAPTMVFPADISVTVGRDGYGNEEYAQVKVGHITDPLFMSLSGRQYARLALCVVPEAAP